MLAYGRYFIVHNDLWFIDLSYLSKKYTVEKAQKKSLNMAGDEHMTAH